jgi:hypothetical protein
MISTRSSAAWTVSWRGCGLLGCATPMSLPPPFCTSSCLGPPLRTTTDYPKVRLHEAMAFVGALVDHGVKVDYRHVPFSEPSWREALLMHCKAQLMAATIEDEMSKPRAASQMHDNDDEALVASIEHVASSSQPLPRRTRMGI